MIQKIRVGPFKFLSTPSARRATRTGAQGYQLCGISIHALREEGDSQLPIDEELLFNFYPRPPRGGRPPGQRSAAGLDPISIHALREEGDLLHLTDLVARNISIHALREEGDLWYLLSKNDGVYFYPRPPRGGRQQKQRQNLYFQTNYTTFCTNLEEP